MPEKTTRTVTRRRTTANRKTTKASTVVSNQIAERAYALFLERGMQHGHDLEDWLQAEQELQPS